MAQPQREWFEKDYYATLGVAKSATEKEITKAYRKLAKENHPDSHPGREDRFKEISTAYAVLSDTDKRSSYDEVRAAGNTISYVVNGTVVHTTPKSGMTAKTDGIVGIRVNHLLDVHVDGFAVK